MSQYKPVSFEDFSGGEFNRKDIYATPDNAAYQITNFELDDNNKLRSRYGSEHYTSFRPTSSVSSLFYYQKAADTYFSTLLAITRDGRFYAGQLNSAMTQYTLSSGGIINGAALDFYWETFNDIAIGCSGTNVLPISFNGTTLSTLSANAPTNGRLCEVWNSRLFIVGNQFATPNRLYYCTIGNPTDWITTGVTGSGFVEIGYNDGDVISGVIADKERFIIFKGGKVYQIITANPNTDPTGWRVELLTAYGGCLHPRTVQALDDDIVFLSAYGVQSLKRVQLLGDFEKASLSAGKVELYTRSGVASILGVSVLSCVFPDRNQYWISVASNRFHIMQKNQQGDYVWTGFVFYTNSNGDICYSYSAATIPTITGKAANCIFMADANMQVDGTYAIIKYPQSTISGMESSGSVTDPTLNRDGVNGPAGTYLPDCYFFSKYYWLNTGYIRNRLNRLVTRLKNASWLTRTKVKTILFSKRTGIELNEIAFNETFNLAPFSNSISEFIAPHTFSRRINNGRNAQAVSFAVEILNSDQENGNRGQIILDGFVLDIMPLNRRRI